MDHWPLRVLIALPIGIISLNMLSMLFQVLSSLKVLLTLLAKHTTGMVLIMVSLRFIAQQVNGKDLVLAMAIVQGARYLGTILLQPLAALCIERGGYQVMSFFLAGVVGIVFAELLCLKMPKGRSSRTFGGKVD